MRTYAGAPICAREGCTKRVGVRGREFCFRHIHARNVCEVEGCDNGIGIGGRSLCAWHHREAELYGEVGQANLSHIYIPTAPLKRRIDALYATGTSQEVIAKRAGFTSRRWVNYYINRDSINMAIADRLAVASGAHPVEIWPDWFDIDTSRKANPRLERERAAA